MFNFIDIGERAGSGILNIFRIWKEQGWAEPIITESYEPDRIMLSLPLTKPTQKTGGKKLTAKTITQRDTIIEYLTDNPEGTVSEFETLNGVKKSRVKEILYY